MKKSHRIALNIASIVCIHVLAYQCNYYPIHIIERFSGSNLVEIIFNIIVFSIQAIFLTLVFHKDSSFFSGETFKIFDGANRKHVCFKFFGLCIFQILYDFLLIQISQKLSFKWSYTASDILNIFYWLVIYLILANKKRSFLKSKNCLISFFSVTTVILFCSFLWNINSIGCYNEISQKYLPDAPYLLRERLNLDFLFVKKTLIIHTVMAIILILFHSFGISNENYEEDKLLKGNESSKLLIRIYLIFQICALILLTKIIISPFTTCVVRSDVDTGCITPPKSISIMENNERIFRGFEVGYTDDIPVYALLNAEITFFTEQLNLTLNPEVKNSVQVLGDFKNQSAGSSIECIVDETSVFVFLNYAISFLDNGNPRIITMSELDVIENNPIVVKILEKLISNGYVFAFEYGCDYLLKNDANFIIPYIDRYCVGDFNKNETEWMKNSYYKSDYIVDIAKCISD